MKWLLILPILISFVLTAVFLPKWIRKGKQLGLLWEDMNKPERKKNVVSSGGLVVIMAFTLGVLLYVAFRTFLMPNLGDVNVQIFSLLSVILILGIIGITDDLLDFRRASGGEIHVTGLSSKFRIFLAIFASIPLVVINAGVHMMNFPFVGLIDFGLFYPLFLIPLGVAGATTTYNFLAGFNGLEAGQGIIILTFLSFIAYTTGSSWLALIGLCMVFSLIAFYLKNKFPAKVFPGDVLTYPIGGLIACMAILGNFERIAVFVFIPYIIETILKLRGRLRKYSFGKPNSDGSLEMPYDKIYGLTHLSLFILKKVKKKVYEDDVVYLIFSFQIIICLLSLFIFGGSLIW